MARNVIQYDLLISCPGDIKNELPLIDKAVENFNTMFSDALGITVRTKHWRKSSYSQSGGKPQKLLNEQFVKDCDAAIALFWTRFGTPTDEYGSGTEEEIEIMLSAGKQVFMYFSDKPIPPSEHNAEEYQKVQAFREKYKDRGIYFTYSSDEEFYKLFFAHLTQYFVSEKRVAEVRAERKSVLTLKGIDEKGKISQNAIFQELTLNTDRTFRKEVENIKQLIADVSGIHVSTLPGKFGSAYRAFNTPVELDSTLIDTIKETANALELELPEDFFCIGNLTKDTLSTPTMFGNPKYNGTEDEKKKYNLLQKLYYNICDALKWGDVETGFKDIKCIKLALINAGTCADEDIDVTITIHKKHYKPIHDLLNLKEETMKYLTQECNLYELLGIQSTSEYGNYDSSIHNTTQSNTYRGGVDLFGGVDYEERYEEELKDIFCYDIFQDGEYYVIKLKVDYLKHNTIVAFPAAILLKEKIDSIDYTITSKNSSEVITGSLPIC